MYKNTVTPEKNKNISTANSISSISKIKQNKSFFTDNRPQTINSKVLQNYSKNSQQKLTDYSLQQQELILNKSIISQNKSAYSQIPNEPVVQGFGLWLAKKYIQWEDSRNPIKQKQKEEELHKKFEENDIEEQNLNIEYSDKNTSQKRRGEIKKRLIQLENERTEYVDKIISGNHRMWLGSKKATDNEDNQKLWQNVHTGKAGIKFVDNKENTLKLKANMAKLMQSEHAREMIKSIDPKSKNLYLTNNAKAYTKDNDIKNKPSSWAGPIDPVSSLSFSYNFQTSKNAVHKNSGPSQNELINLDYNDHHIDSVSTDNQNLHSPNYITLGHELGHAIGRMTGKSSPKNPMDIGQNPVGRDKEFSELKNGPTSMWNNPEEYRNINDNENAIRRQLNLPERQYHVTFDCMEEYSMNQEIETWPEKDYFEYLNEFKKEADNLPKNANEQDLAKLKKEIMRKHCSKHKKTD